MRRLLILFLFLCWNVGATTFTEFYTDCSNGSTNINAGSTTNATPVYIALNGNWDGTSVYTPTDGSTPASTVSAGMWAAVFVDGSTNLVQSSAGGCVMLITNVAAGANGAITFNRAAFMGTAPSSSATGRSIRVGGCWNGPYGSIGFPFGFATSAGTNGANAAPRVNFRNTAQYNITAAMTHDKTGPARFQGMTTTAGDGGIATIDGGTTGNYYVLLTVSANNNDLSCLKFANNGSASTAQSGVIISGFFCLVERCVFTALRKAGLEIGGAGIAMECEAYNCLSSATAGFGAFYSSASLATFVRCYSHNNSLHGFASAVGSPLTLRGCISSGNSGSGFLIPSTTDIVESCSSYNNTLNGFDISRSSVTQIVIENSIAIKNGSYGINSANANRNGTILNCLFGSGTQTNSSGNISGSFGAVNEVGTVTYTADQTPWVDPANGDFRLSAGATLAKAAGRGSFTQLTVNSPTNTVSYPDIGAAQSASTNSAAGGGAYTWAQ